MKGYPLGLQTMLEFPLSQALFGRRSRRFALGSALPEGPLAFTSRHEPLPLTELEQMVLLTATAGVTGWNYLLKRHDRYGPALPNYSASAGGRTFPGAPTRPAVPY
jgi:hypothetical protein